RVTPRALAIEVRLLIENKPTAIVRWRPGSELPLHRCSGGLLYLAHLTPDRLAETVAALKELHPGDPPADWQGLDQRLEEARRLGYAIGRTTERESGFAVPIRRAGR